MGSQSVTMAVEQSCDGCSQCDSNPEYHQRRARNRRAVRKHRTQKQKGEKKLAKNIERLKMENQELERSIRSKGSELELLAKISTIYGNHAKVGEGKWGDGVTQENRR